MVNNKESFSSTLVISGTFVLSITSSVFVSAILSFYQELKYIFFIRYSAS